MNSARGRYGRMSEPFQDNDTEAYPQTDGDQDPVDVFMDLYSGSDIAQPRYFQTSDEGIDTFFETIARWKSAHFQRALSALSIVAVVVSGYIAFDGYMANRQLREQLAVLGAQVENTDEDSSIQQQGSGSSGIFVPDETPIADEELLNYQVAADEPRYLEIPRFNTKARVFHVGRTADNAVDVPKNIHDAAWFDESARLSGDSGVAFMLGHVSGVDDPGIFFDLYKLETGDEIVVEMGDGLRKTFEVTARQQYPVDDVDMERALHNQDNLPGLQLNLMTCSGQFDAERATFDHRLLVTTRQIQ